MTFTTALPAVAAAFLASLVEIVEAFTIILAVAVVRGARPAVQGAIAGLVALVALVILLGPAIDRIPLQVLQIAIGVLLLLFGLRWLRKAILRAAGIVALHDETGAFAKETAELTGAAGTTDSIDWIGAATAFKAVLIEGIEVVFIVVAVGAGRGLLVPAGLGAAAACILVLLVGAALHRPLAQVPENSLKFVVGVMLSAFGTFWTGEGLGVDWPGGDGAIVAFAAAFLIAGLALAGLLSGRRRALP